MISPYKNIVLIDDDAINNLLNRQFLSFVLPQSTINTFHDARLLVRYLVEGKIARPDLIFLDINMPEMDGWEFLYHMDRINCNAEVMILSSSLHWDDIQKAKDYQRVKCYIEKPLTEDKIERYLIHQKFENIELD
ncbi:MAG: response regulator [Flavobacteriales bacterium]|nr:response regulator [Flavobacteriales bacterium]MDG2246549.1 response regulator [Flavobacteriales bacterium]